MKTESQVVVIIEIHLGKRKEAMAKQNVIWGL